ncbi:MAG: hypothetical protein U0V72_01095 [Cytophagales bacterium]
MNKIFQIGNVTVYRFKYMMIIHHERPMSKFSAMALFPPLILLWKKSELHNYRLYKHECIHHRQMLETLIIPFYIIYLLEYFYSRFKGRNQLDAYRFISFEREAYRGEHVKNYASKPRWYGFTKFFRIEEVKKANFNEKK